MRGALAPEAAVATASCGDGAGEGDTSPRSTASQSPRGGPGGGTSSPRLREQDAWPEPCEQQAALLDTWHESTAFLGAPEAQLRASAALAPPDAADAEPPLLAVAGAKPADAWTRVAALAEDQAAREAAACEPRPPDAENDDAAPAAPPSEPEFALRLACRVARIALTRGAFRDVAAWTAGILLAEAARLGPLARRVLDDEAASGVDRGYERRPRTWTGQRWNKSLLESEIEQTSRVMS